MAKKREMSAKEIRKHITKYLDTPRPVQILNDDNLSKQIKYLENTLRKSKNLADRTKTEIYSILTRLYEREALNILEEPKHYGKGFEKKIESAIVYAQKAGEIIRAKVLFYRYQEFMLNPDWKYAHNPSSMKARFESFSKIMESLEKISILSSILGVVGGVIMLASGFSRQSIQLSPGEVALNNEVIWGGILIVIGIVAGSFWLRYRKLKKKKSKNKVKKRR